MEAVTVKLTVLADAEGLETTMGDGVGKETSTGAVLGIGFVIGVGFDLGQRIIPKTTAAAKTVITPIDTIVFIPHNYLNMTSALIAIATALTIVTPKASEVVNTDQVTLRVAAPNFNFVDFKTHPWSAYRQGHMHIWLDEKNPKASTAIKATSNVYTLTNLKPGPHTLTVELVNNDHSSLSPKMVATTTFTSTVPTTDKDQRSVVMISILAFVLLVIALYFVNSKEFKAPIKKKFSKK